MTYCTSSMKLEKNVYLEQKGCVWNDWFHSSLLPVSGFLTWVWNSSLRNNLFSKNFLPWGKYIFAEWQSRHSLLIWTVDKSGFKNTFKQRISEDSIFGQGRFQSKREFHLIKKKLGKYLGKQNIGSTEKN